MSQYIYLYIGIYLYSTTFVPCHMSLEDFVENCNVLLQQRRGKELSNYLSIHNFALKQVSSKWNQNLSLKGILPSGYDEFILQIIAASHFEQQIETCFTYLAEALRILCTFLREEKSWIVPVLLRLSKELRQVAEKVQSVRLPLCCLFTSFIL